MLAPTRGSPFSSVTLPFIYLLSFFELFEVCALFVAGRIVMNFPFKLYSKGLPSSIFSKTVIGFSFTAFIETL